MASVPGDAPQPQDQKPKKKSSAARAREAEAADDFVVIEQRGVKLRIPVGNMPIAAMDAARAGDDYGCTRALLGEVQWKALSDAGAGSRDLVELGKKLKEATGGN